MTTTSVTTSTTSNYTVSAGNELLVESGGNVTSTTVLTGGSLVVSGGVETSATISSGGTETVSKGSASGDLIFGTVSTISGGSGVFANETVENGGTFNLLNGNSAAGTTVLSGGLFLLSGNNGAVTSTVLSGGGTLELDSPKANISGSLTFSGGGNTLDVAVVASTGSGDLAVISGFSSTDKIDVTALGAATGSAALSFGASGGNEDVTVSGTGGSETFIFAGTSTYTGATLSVVSGGGHEYIEYSSGGSSSSGGATTSVTTSTASGAYTETAGNTLLVLSGGSVSAATIDDGAFLTVNGGADTSATISSGGAETVSTGLATGDAIYGGATVDSGGTVTNETVENGGRLTIVGGVDSATSVLAGGTETVTAGSATGDMIYGTVSTISKGTGVFTSETVENGGTFDLLNGNSAAGTTVLGGGLFFISGANGPVTGTVLNGGGTVELDSPKATISGSLTFENGGNTLEIADTTDAGDGTLATISGFSSSDKINITSAAYPGSALTLSQTVSGGDAVAQVISAGTTVETFTFSNPALAGDLALLPDGNGGVDLEIVPVDVTTSVTTSTAPGAYTELPTDTLLVLNGGSVSAATIDDGGFLTVNGGTDTAATIQAGGVETISAGSASGDQIYGSAIVSGGTVSSETVFGGGQLTVDGGSVSNIVLGGGGLLDLATPTATISGTLTFAGGDNTLEASAIADNGAGDQAVISGFSTSDKIDVTGISATGASLTFTSNSNGTETATISGTGGSESFIFAGGTVPSFTSGTIADGGTMTLMKDGANGVDLVVDTTPAVTFTSLNGLQTNQPTDIVNGTVNTTVDPEAIGTTVSVMEGNSLVGAGTVGANGYWSANVTFANDDGTNVLTASDTDGADNTGSTTQSLTYNVDTSAPAFTAGNLVISISGDGDGSGVYGDNQASPMTLEQITTTGTIVSQIVMPETTAVVNGVTEYAISSEYGSSSEGTLELSADGKSLVIAGYGVNPETFNEGGAAVYGTAAEAQSTSILGGQYTAVPRVIADINTDGVVDTSTALYDIFNNNNPRSVATVDGSSFYISGQGVKGDTTQGVFYAQDGASSATSINDATDTRTAEIYNGNLYVSADSTQGATGIFDYGPVSSVSPPSGQVTPTVLPGIDLSVTLTATNGNTVNDANGSGAGTSVFLSPENFFFANSTTLYIADGGAPKNGGLGDGGLQKWSLVNGTWTLDYTLSAGLNLIPNTAGSASSGDTGLIGLTGEVVGNSVELFATTEPLNDLGNTAVVEITDALGATSGVGETFTTVLTASPGENIRGIAFAPTESAAPCYCPGTLILTSGGEVPVETLAIGDRVMTKLGEARAIKWIGRRSYGGRFALGRKDILPVCIKAGALADNVPKRDLWISPNHAMYFKDQHLDGVLIEARDLVNGTSIVQADSVEMVEYIHVELDNHDVIIAEGALAESFIDDDNRGLFHNAYEFRALYPAAAPMFAQYCAPRLQDGYELEALRQRITLRAGLASRGKATAVAKVRGYVDRITTQCVAGWAQNLDHPEVPVCLDICAGGQLIGQVLANCYREDLVQTGIGSGRHSFAFTLPQAPTYAFEELEVRRSLDGVALELTHGARRMLLDGGLGASDQQRAA